MQKYLKGKNSNIYIVEHLAMKIDKIKEVVELAYLSSFLKDEKPISLMLIAPPENSKTHFILGYKTDRAHISTDLSFQGLVKKLSENKKIKQIVIGDFLKITGKKQSTKNNVLTLLNAFTEEGIFDINLGNKEKLDFKGRNGGIITATTTKSFAQNKKSWEALGFSSRFLLIQYKYSDDTMDAILDKIINGEEKQKPKKLKLEVKSVDCSKEIKKELKEMCNKSPRRFKILLVLLKTIALKNNHTKVCKNDLEKLKSFSEILTEREFTL